MSGSAEPPDLRLAALAAGTWSAALGALYLPVPAAAGLVVAAGGLAGWVALSTRLRSTVARVTRGRVGGWVLTAALLGVVCGGAATAARLVARDAEPLAGLVRAGAHVSVDLVVRDDPRPLSSTAGRPPLWLVPADLTGFRMASGGARVALSARIVVLASDPAWRGRLPGERLAATGRLLSPRGGDLTAAVLSATGPPQLLAHSSWAQRAAGALRAGLQRACAPLADEPGGLLPGLVVGDTSRLDPAVAEDFRATGLTHLVAVSGANVAIVLGAVLLLVRWVRAGPRLAAGACGLALVGFVILARPSPSVVRAAAMGVIALVALAAGRPRAAVPALCAGVTGLIVVDPGLAGDAGFALSVLATGGLLLLAPRWRAALRARGVPAGVAEALAVPAAAQVACGPVVAGLSGAVSLVAVPANLLVAPAIVPATVFGVAAAVLSPLWPAGAQLLAWLGGWPAGWLVTVARYGAGVPAGALPWPGGVGGGVLLGALTVAVLVAARRAWVRRVAVIVALAAMLGALPVRLVASGWPPSGWLLVACAVGQGDAVVLPAGPGRAVVVDAGPEPAATDRCLRRLGVRGVPLLVVSHFHADHVGGVAGIFRSRAVGLVVTPAWSEPAAGRAAVTQQAAARGTPVHPAGVGWQVVLGDVSLTVLGPPHPLTGTRSDANNNSLVLRVRVRGVEMLLAGDAEGEEQRAVLERVGAAGVRAQVLKVAHHGSAYQEVAFLDAVHPAVAFVSVGADNPYGHPNASVLARLRRGGARVLRTDVDGDVAVVLAGRGMAVVVGGLDPARRPP